MDPIKIVRQYDRTGISKKIRVLREIPLEISHLENRNRNWGIKLTMTFK